MNIYIPIAISILYLLIIPIGTHFMASRPPFRIKTFSLIHNSILFALSLYMVVETLAACYENFGWNRFVQGGWNSGASIFCNANDPKLDAGEPVFRDGFSKSGYRLARVLWIHYVSKAYEFVDTVIMILKKNNRQISFLHVYHHATTFFPVWWAVVTYGPGGEAWFCCFLNSLVHVFMYGYYFFASLGISITIIKKSITKFQMIQFLCFIGQSTWLLFIKDCYSPRLSPWMLLVQCTIFFALFFHFYVTSYTNKNKDKKKVK
ncbi:very long chain fatty acids elongation protein 4 [Pycnococcus provasolii]